MAAQIGWNCIFGPMLQEQEKDTISSAQSNKWSTGSVSIPSCTGIAPDTSLQNGPRTASNPSDSDSEDLCYSCNNSQLVSLSGVPSSDLLGCCSSFLIQILERCWLYRIQIWERCCDLQGRLQSECQSGLDRIAPRCGNDLNNISSQIHASLWFSLNLEEEVHVSNKLLLRRMSRTKCTEHRKLPPRRRNPLCNHCERSHVIRHYSVEPSFIIVSTYSLIARQAV
jgi:hypothetical protein